MIAVRPNTYRRLLARIERESRKRIAAELAAGYADAIAAWDRTGDVPALTEHSERLRLILEDVAARSVRAFATETNAAFAKAERKDFAATLAKLATRYISLEAFRRRITDIAETTRQNVIDAVQRGFDAGLGQEGVGGFVRSLVPSFSRQRANLIARTETHGAANYGAMGAAAETGLTLRKV